MTRNCSLKIQSPRALPKCGAKRHRRYGELRNHQKLPLFSRDLLGHGLLIAAFCESWNFECVGIPWIWMRSVKVPKKAGSLRHNENTLTGWWQIVFSYGGFWMSSVLSFYCLAFAQNSPTAVPVHGSFSGMYSTWKMWRKVLPGRNGNNVLHVPTHNL